MKKLKIFLMISILLLCFGFILSPEVHAQGDGPKVFEVNDVLPATTQLRISWSITATSVPNFPYIDGSYYIASQDIYLINIFVADDVSKPFRFYINSIKIKEIGSVDSGWISPFTDADGNHAYIDIDTSNWSVSERTITTITDPSINNFFYWEDLNAPSGYTITFNSNGGTTIADIEEATELPDPLPTPTKSGYTFSGWFYDSDFTNEALAGDPLTSDVTLYAKWGPKAIEVGDVLPEGYIKISWDYNGLSFGYTNLLARIQGTNGFIINITYYYPELAVDTIVMGDPFDTMVDNTTIKLDNISVITEITSEIENIQEHIFWEVVTVDEYSLGYDDARDKFGYYDSITQRWLSVEEYLDLYGYEKMDQTDFYNNFDKYFIPAMIIVFGSAIVLTLLKVFKGRE
jgi:uncharacterized repeat protein (TIGR02543 family)